MGFTGVKRTVRRDRHGDYLYFLHACSWYGKHVNFGVLGNNVAIVSPARGPPLTFLDPDTGEVYNPTRWKFTTADGVVYVIDEQDGIQHITDADGNSLSIDRDSHQHSTGLGLVVDRDLQGRIASITDPMSESFVTTTTSMATW